MRRIQRYRYVRKRIQKYPPPKVIAIDVDKTLIKRSGAVNSEIVNWARHQHQEGYQIIIWSSRGAENAQKAAELAKLTDIILIAMSKPGFVVDDKGWQWIKYTKVVSDTEILNHPANQKKVDE